ncbi:MAG TPA: TetR/AcrR family transcriptional regulator [Sphingomicrobium sp.]|nr:TetR/AcrR family transcriptional regulator [Sphingomicrobium sp.]
MPTKPLIDRRSARTRRMLHEALMKLILRKHYDSITVQHIIDEADVGRATFYAHYAGKDDLLRRGFDHFRAELFETRAQRPNGDATPQLNFSSVVFAHVERFKDIYRALVGSKASSIALREFRRLMVEAIRPEIAKCDHPRVPRELLAHFIADSIQSVVMWWVELHPELSGAVVHEMFRELVAPVLAGACREARFAAAAA